MTPRDVVKSYYDRGFSPLFWPAVGDAKGPHAKNWVEQRPTIDSYVDGCRVGVFTGTEIAAGKFLVDADIDWAPGVLIAQKFLPATQFAYGRASKRLSHCFYTVPEPLPSIRYEDIDKSCLLEVRGNKSDGTVGFQTMVPPSVWSKEGATEELSFILNGDPGHYTVKELKYQTCLAAIGMLLAKHFGKNGFGHEPRMAWAGFLLRAGVSVNDLVTMGEAISIYTNNLEIQDVRQVVESTASRLTTAGQKIKGGPALIKIFGPSGKEILTRINEWLGREQDFRRNNGVIVKDDEENIRRALSLMEIELSNQTFAERQILQQAGGPPKLLDDKILNDLWFQIDREYHFRPNWVYFERCISQIACSKPFHPVREYLDSLVWDGKPRVDRWLATYGGAPISKYHDAVAAIVLIAAVRRIRQPGCKYDEMVVLESRQGLNKSSALRSLCPHDDWFSDDLPLNVDAKQIIERTLGKWIIEASDLTGGRKADRDHLKSMLSRQVDGPARLAYDRKATERARQFIVVGTTNSGTYLADTTGARRFWPITVQRFDVEGIKRDRDQLWAEAAAREATGASIRLDESLWSEAGKHQEARRELDAWEDVIQDALMNIPVGHSGRIHVANETLWEVLSIEPARRDRMSGVRLSEIMQHLGYIRGTVRINGGKPQRGYVGPPIQLDFEGGE